MPKRRVADDAAGGQRKVVIIGAGIVGCTLADELTARGWTDVTVLDQGPLPKTGGSTSHAPGLVFQVNTGSKMLTELSRASVKRYSELRYDDLPAWHGVGSIEVARTPERWADLHRKLGAAASWGVEARLISPDDVHQLVPIMDTSRILGGLHVPSDGLAKAVRACQALTAAAEARGARFVGNAEVTAFETGESGVRTVVTEAGRFEADLVVCCAGIWGPHVARLAGIEVPLLPTQHLYAITRPLPELAGDAEQELVHPILRDQDVQLYYRQVGNRYGVGSYRHEPLGVDPADLARNRAQMREPAMLAFTPELFEPGWTAALEVLPTLPEPPYSDSFNGIFSFTTDGMPVCGPSRRVRNLWTAEAIWVTHGPGTAKAVAEWIVDGHPSIDLREADIARFEAHQTSPAYVVARGLQNYREVYDIIHPLQPMNDSRPARTTPFYPRQVALDASFIEGGGWERPAWYEANRGELDGRVATIPPREGWAAQFWSAIAGAEHQVTRERVALFDMSPLKKIEVSGPGALAFLQRLTTNQLDRPVGTIVYTLMLDRAGGIRSDLTVTRLAPDRFQVGANGNQDLAWFEEHLPADGSVALEDVTAARCCVGVWGPRAREVVQSLSRDDFSPAGSPFFRARTAYLRDVPVTALRLSYVGELGWELYTSVEYGLRLWDLLWAAGQPHGIIAAGRTAFTSLRIEKGYRAWGTDMWTEMTPEEAGLGWTVRLDKGEFIGREALAAGRRPDGPWRRFPQRVLRPLTLDDPQAVVLGKEPVFAGDDVVGFVTSAGYGYSVGRAIAYAWISEPCATEGTPLTIDYFGHRLAATVAPDPLFDPQMRRMKA